MKLSLSAAVLAVVILLSAGDAAAACAPGPSWYDNGYSFYQHLRRDSSPLDCWTYSATGVTTESTYCGLSPANGVKFTGWTQQISQQFTIDSAGGAGNYGTNWELVYELDFDDPYNSSAWNRIEAEVYVIDSGGSTLVAWNTFTGADGDVTCSRRSTTFSGNYEGKDMLVIIKSKRGWSDVVQRVRNMALIQRNP